MRAFQKRLIHAVEPSKNKTQLFNIFTNTESFLFSPKTFLSLHESPIVLVDYEEFRVIDI